MPITDLHQLFVHELQDLYSTETQLLQALPKMISAASNEKLKKALSEHLEVTKGHVDRLKTISGELDFTITGHQCQGIKGIITEAEATLKDISNAPTKDAAIIVSAQRAEHYEIAAYGGTLQFAEDMGHTSAAGLLKKTLKEEGEADKALTGIAEGGLFSEGINEAAILE